MESPQPRGTSGEDLKRKARPVGARQIKLMPEIKMDKKKLTLTGTTINVVERNSFLRITIMPGKVYVLHQSPACTGYYLHY